MKAFLRESEAWAHIQSVPDPQVRLLAQISLGIAISSLARDTEYQRICAQSPIDLLVYARTLTDIFRRIDIISGVLNGDVSSVDDLEFS